MDMTRANVLPNGAQILSRYKRDEQGPPEDWVVLCYWEGFGPQPYVTWRTDGYGNAYWGQYYATYDEAQDSFCRRVKGAAAFTSLQHEGSQI